MGSAKGSCAVLLPETAVATPSRERGGTGPSVLTPFARVLNTPLRPASGRPLRVTAGRAFPAKEAIPRPTEGMTSPAGEGNRRRRGAGATAGPCGVVVGATVSVVGVEPRPLVRDPPAALAAEP